MTLVFFIMDILEMKLTMGYLIKYFATKKMVCKNQYLIEIFGLSTSLKFLDSRSNELGDQNLSYLVKKLSIDLNALILYKPLWHFLNCKAKKQPPEIINVTNFGKYRNFPESLKDSSHRKYNFVTSLYVKYLKYHRQ